MKKAEGEEPKAPKTRAPRAEAAEAAPKKSAPKKAESPEKPAKAPAKKVSAKAAAAKTPAKTGAKAATVKAAAAKGTSAKAAAKAPTPKAAPKAAAAKRAAKRLAPLDLAQIVAAAAMEHKLVNPVLLDVTGLSSVADCFFIATAENARQMGAIADKIIRRVREHGLRPLGREGQLSAQWALVDLGDVIVHLFSPEARELYDLEGLWADAPKRGFSN